MITQLKNIFFFFFFNKENFDKSVEIATRWEHEVQDASYDTQACIGKIYINIAEGSIIREFLKTNLLQGSVTWGSFESLTFSNEQIAERYNSNFVFEKLDKQIEKSIDRNGGRAEVDQTRL